MITREGKETRWDEETEGLQNADVLRTLRQLASETMDIDFQLRINNFIWVVQHMYSGEKYFKFGFGDGLVLTNLMRQQIWIEQHPPEN